MELLESASTAAVRSLWPAAYGLALSLTGDPGRSEDLAQEALLRLLRSGGALEEASPPRALVLRIVRNLAIDEARRAVPGSLEAGSPDGPPRDPRARDPADAALVLEETARVRAGLEQLSPLWRGVLYLRDGLGLGYADIAAIMGRSRDVVRVTLHRARLRIREILGDAVKEGAS